MRNREIPVFARRMSRVELRAVTAYPVLRVLRSRLRRVVRLPYVDTRSCQPVMLAAGRVAFVRSPLSLHRPQRRAPVSDVREYGQAVIRQTPANVL